MACGIGHADVKVIKISFQWKRGAPGKNQCQGRDAISLRMKLAILKLVIGRDGGIIIPQKICSVCSRSRCSTSCLSENPVYAFRTIRAIFAEGLNLFLRRAPVRQAGGFCHIQTERLEQKLAKLTLIKTPCRYFSRISFPKTQSR